uniref:Uncharacterized protein n=1 Tax=Anguilla anguilla TaxID=7936 RepID=A0A0E9RQQ9_ANGAN
MSSVSFLYSRRLSEQPSQRGQSGFALSAPGTGVSVKIVLSRALQSRHGDSVVSVGYVSPDFSSEKPFAF